MPLPYRSAQAVKIQGGTVPVKPDKQALLDGVKAAYTQAKQNADAAAAAAEDVANAMKQLEDDEELALLRTDNKAAIKALTAEEAKNALNMLHPDTLDTAAAPMGNLKVMPTDILPLALCDQDWVNEMKNVTMADGRPYLTIYQHDQLVPFCMWWTISRFPEFQGQLAASEMPWKAVPDDDGHVLGRPFAPQPMLASPFQNFPLVMPWMGCRCAWPVSQLGLLMQRFYQYAPNSRSWDYIAKQRSPLTIRVTEARGVVIDFIFMPLFIGLLAFGSDSSKNLNYFETKTMYRILLRSLSTKEAGQTFAYCTLVTWSVLTEIGSVIFPAYITFMAPVIFHVVYSGEVLTDMASFILLFNTIFDFEQKACIFEVNLWFFERPVTRLIDCNAEFASLALSRTAAAWDDDCRWEPTASSFKSQAFMWRVWRVTGARPPRAGVGSLRSTPQRGRGTTLWLMRR
ncbi:hypothetical protein EMIHUDRAFT_103576 [Emiliania huxleyi CCMP1516]|uniref:Ion transport domain-containing protein n=2 Tax=Emiliania huxleyi TaxID=2903 RepID=A0A0D3IS74_EMIH1|nr:hypothetical protein EMIHUDRAFT_103576 [Emiliania huxleyi CCMP1516]EOD14109.1 hypothetical protein EMIHUDRAFT_103576 [Emiliania huxleyi CCMP1516]|eukprot:XP_005766538.1 hypothetical protein EMIHUDRAFT_103576 [Emiliania huxleyi CCMP1516]